MDSLHQAHELKSEHVGNRLLDLGRLLDVGRVRRLRDNVIDLDVALNDLDAELAPLLARRADLAAMLHDAETELAAVLERIAA